MSPFKDVDGFQTVNVGELSKRGGTPYFVPCTPKGVMVLLEESKVEIRGKRAVVLGRSDIVGKPVSYLLDKADATVTLCHSKTPNVTELVIPSINLPDLLLDISSRHPRRRYWHTSVR